MADSKKKTSLRTLRSRVDYWAEGPMLDFVEDLSSIMKQEGISQAELAKRTDTQAAYVSQILEGDTNFTIKSMVKLALALDHKIRIHLAPLSAQTQWFDLYTGPQSTVVADGFTESDSLVGTVETAATGSGIAETKGVAING